ncbi:MAG TPA: hypothetical protein VFV86_03785 [Nitrososphaeraceae archaeon]|nr:hypothetical protein [Nitrososphaeraceae archaeon]
MECNLFHVYNWTQFFISIYNDRIYKDEFIMQLQEEVNNILNQQSLGDDILFSEKILGEYTITLQK